MRNLIRALPLALAALLLLVAVACGSGSTSPSTSNTGDGGSEDLVSSNPLDVLSASAESFQQDVQSVEAEVEFTITLGGFDVSATGEMSFQAPSDLHMTMALTGLGEFEMLILGNEIYMNIPPQGWVVFSAEDLLDDLGAGDLGLNAEAFQEVLSGHSFVDYQELLGSIGGDIVDLGDETIDGRTYRRYQADLDFGDLANSFSDAFGATDSLNLDEVSGPLTFDIWVDPETALPYKLTASGEFPFGADSMLFDATMLFTGYNEPLDIPGAPEDAIPFSELLAGLIQQ